MHFNSASLLALLFSGAVSASLIPRAENGPCTGAGGAPGACISTADCSSGGGTSIAGACPGTPDNIRCCTKASCGSGGSCNWQSSCSGTSVPNLCPGPAGFMCCQSSGGGGGGPTIPPVGDCKAVSVAGARTIVNQFGNRILEIHCKRACACPGTSEHCCGLATDLMTSALGTKTDRGQIIAEWVMNNRASLKLLYVIWGQKIWNPSRDAVTGWANWRGMEDRGDNTQNHWDHVHVSYQG